MKKTWIKLISFALLFVVFLSSQGVEAKKIKNETSIPIAVREGCSMFMERVASFRDMVGFRIKDELYFSLHELAYFLNEGTDPFNIVWNPTKKRTEIHLHQEYLKEAPIWNKEQEKIAIHWASADLWIGEKSEKFIGFIYDNQFFVSLKQLANYVGFSYQLESNGWYTIIFSTKYPEGIVFSSSSRDAIFPNQLSTDYNDRWAEPKENFLYKENDKYIYKKPNYEISKNNKYYLMKDVYSKNWTKLESKELPFYGEKFGGFLAGKNYNYFLFGRDNWKNDNNLNVYTVIKTDKNFKEVGRTDIHDCYTNTPFEAGTASFAEFDNHLILHTCRIQYNGHQTQFTVVIDIPTMKLLTKNISDYQYNHVSHSLNQFALFDNDGNAFLIDHGDASPSRSIQILKMDKKLEKKHGWAELFPIPGESGANETGVSIGDVLQTEKDIIVGVNQIDYSKATFFWQS